MTKKDNEFIKLIPQLIKIANNELIKINSFLPVGTYNAISIDRYLRLLFKEYLKMSRKCLKVLKSLRNSGFNGVCELYANEFDPEDIVTISTNELILRFPRLAIFYILWKVEVYAGINSERRHRFHIPPVGEEISNGEIEFMDKRQMTKFLKVLAQQRKELINPDDYKIEINLTTGKINFGLTEWGQSYTPTSFNNSTRLKPFNLLSIEILTKLHDICKIKVYKKQGKQYLVFETSEGYITSNYKLLYNEIEIPSALKDIFERKEKFMSGKSYSIKPKFVSSPLF